MHDDNIKMLKSLIDDYDKAKSERKKISQTWVDTSNPYSDDDTVDDYYRKLIREKEDEIELKYQSIVAFTKTM